MSVEESPTSSVSSLLSEQFRAVLGMGQIHSMTTYLVAERALTSRWNFPPFMTMVSPFVLPHFSFPEARRSYIATTVSTKVTMPG
jgi:hypothetical protein